MLTVWSETELNSLSVEVQLILTNLQEHHPQLEISAIQEQADQYARVPSMPPHCKEEELLLFVAEQHLRDNHQPPEISAIQEQADQYARVLSMPPHCKEEELLLFLAEQHLRDNHLHDFHDFLQQPQEITAIQEMADQSDRVLSMPPHCKEEELLLFLAEHVPSILLRQIPQLKALRPLLHGLLHL